MGKERQGDIRVQLILWLFFACILVGGVFLSLYFFLPDDEYAEWHYLIGIGLVAVPWVFWFLAYIYTCFKPRPSPPKDPGKAVAAQAPPSPAAGDEGHFRPEVAVTVEDDGRGGRLLAEEGKPGRGSLRVSNSNTSNDIEFVSRESEIPLKTGEPNNNSSSK